MAWKRALLETLIALAFVFAVALGWAFVVASFVTST